MSLFEKLKALVYNIPAIKVVDDISEKVPESVCDLLSYEDQMALDNHLHTMGLGPNDNPVIKNKGTGHCCSYVEEGDHCGCPTCFEMERASIEERLTKRALEELAIERIKNKAR